MQIGTYIEKSISSELSGNMIDLCPVGALTNKPFRYKARAWELNAQPTIAPHDSLGSNIFVHTRNGEVLRVVPRENESINETWISDRDRFSCEALNSADRLTQPLVRVENDLTVMDWQLALEKMIHRLKPYLVNPEQIAILLAPNSTVEEVYLVKKLANALGITNIEHRLRQQDFSVVSLGVDQSLAMRLEEVEELDSLLVVGAYLRKDLPLLNNRVRKAHLAGCKVHSINPAGLEYNLLFENQIDTSTMAIELAGVVKAAADLVKADKLGQLSDETYCELHTSIAQSLIDGEKSSIMLGLIAQTDENYGLIIKLATKLAELTGSSFSDLPASSNTVGANLILDPVNQDLTKWLTSGKKVFINIGIEPEKDCLLADKALQAMKQAELVINFTGFDSDAQRGYADFMLPIALFAENVGTLVNIQQDWQSFKLIANAKGESKPLWKILRVLGNMFDLEGFDYVNTSEVLAEVQALNLQAKKSMYDFDIELSKVEKSQPGLVGCYSVDGLVRRSPALQATPDAQLTNQSN